ncbi:exopolysaccharide biosynthesis polyprenyl glycosylphosphotransferase [Leptobacterium sp. I13]|uniref:exopolysaccharide biosynthesis polyprenyl glycosylphosphotransferase n=1 Tax=Leptobacterium meishanense TaxID=3128904 RepID=UPI0030EC6C84
MGYKRGRYSKFLLPFICIIDLTVVNLTAYILPILFKTPVLFSTYISITWVVIALRNNFYEVHRYSKVTLILSLLSKQFVYYFLALYAFIGFFKEVNISRLLLATYCLIVLIIVAIIKFTFHYLLMKYREKYGGNQRKVIVIGKNKKTDQLVQIFQKRLEYGYEFKKQFSLTEGKNTLKDCFEYVLKENIDEIYCSVSELSNKEIEKIVDFTDLNLRVIKFLPDNKNIYTKKLKYEYYDYLPILSLRDVPLDNPINFFTKRTFDIIFSFLIFFFILLWLIPILGILIKIDSKGPIFFRQNRPGLNEKGFYCYKFRSMKLNDVTEKSATRNDPRVTKLGAFLRKTSIDELPQFINVLLGDMSVVGPRPHLWKQNAEYGKNVNKYMIRHLVKPGITGLAQTRGYRGEIETDGDMINRIKLDIFYIENWSLVLDIKIIIQTALNMIKGEEKAY